MAEGKWVMDAPCEIPPNFCAWKFLLQKHWGEKFMPVVFYEENTLY